MVTTSGSWFYWAILSALFAALTAIFAKVGIQGVDSDLATLVRTAIIIVVLSAFVWFAGKWSNPLTLPSKTWLFLGLSALATGASWVCYFRALQIGDASKVAPVDKFSLVASRFLRVRISRRAAVTPGMGWHCHGGKWRAASGLQALGRESASRRKQRWFGARSSKCHEGTSSRCTGRRGRLRGALQTFRVGVASHDELDLPRGHVRGQRDWVFSCGCSGWFSREAWFSVAGHSPLAFHRRARRVYNLLGVWPRNDVSAKAR